MQKAHVERTLKMAQNPKDNLEKIKRILNAWETLAPAKSFGGMTLAQFKATVQPSLDARDLIDDLEAQQAQAKARGPFTARMPVGLR